MTTLLPNNWWEMFLPETPLLELVMRGSVLYTGILILMRLMPRRAGADLATMDLIFVILIANAAANAFGNYTSLGDAIVLIIILMAWDYMVNSLSYYVPLIERLVAAPPIQVIRDGRIIWRNMRREFLTEQELMSHLRQNGIEKVEAVKAAYVEGEGHIAVIARQE